MYTMCIISVRYVIFISFIFVLYSLSLYQHLGNSYYKTTIRFILLHEVLLFLYSVYSNYPNVYTSKFVLLEFIFYCLETILFSGLIKRYIHVYPWQRVYKILWPSVVRLIWTIVLAQRSFYLYYDSMGHSMILNSL